MPPRVSQLCISFFFYLSVCFSGAKSLKGTDKKQCGNSTSSSKSRYENQTVMKETRIALAFFLFFFFFEEVVMIFLIGGREGGNILSSDSKWKL